MANNSHRQSKAGEFAAKLAGPPLILDGAMGTELERRGVACPAPLWSAAALLRDCDTVERIHCEYAAAGAQIVIANSFRTNPRALHAAGLESRGAALCELAVRLARRATKSTPGTLVAASIAPVEDCYRPDLVPDDAALNDEYARLLGWYLAEPPDIFWIETMNTAREARAAARAVARFEGGAIQFVISFVLREDGRLLGGDSFADAARMAADCGAAAVGVNCIPPRGISELLPALRAATVLPLIAYAHIGNARPTPGWSYSQPVVSPAEYAKHAATWIAAGARIVGGCCGTTPAHIAAIAALWQQW